MVLPKDRVSCWILCPFFCYNREKRRAQMDEAHVYIAIDLKSFYASVECVERGLDPLTTNLVVADPERTEKTICLGGIAFPESLWHSGKSEAL